mmetsp:Transcript_4611/g.6309  ORF Transcript_4611/g.6309 Transcript_4611/m.6309 type:complete len:327 (-) Transcript_4611:546-1526(-)|eukprot:CAMPEP_0185726098 /NCGR_PEP_ID=MMETSP1171-20130828/2177_1 /TAXON_ID=374046 /ORGANISM="Helicotheca tamensis, Strain CCMP826" /LENGTH=326 /DNA_ID=CAMNT_0028394379 /DNA_START=176 /DNA_END=1156 /DNA_ORIENTATION=+
MSEEASLSTHPGRSPRFTHWVAFLICSAITLGAAVEAKNHTEATSSRARSNQNWSVICSAVTFGLTCIVVTMHLFAFTSIFIVGTKIEGLLCITLIAFWAATVSIISDSKHGLAVDASGAVSNGNLYYFSWAGFVCSVTLTVSYLRSAFHVDVAGEIRSRSARLTTWSALLACSLVVMGSSANIFDNDCNVSDDEVYRGNTYCNRTKWGLALGLVATVLSLLVVGMKIATAKAPFLLEAGLSVVLLIMYAFGVAYITSQLGPGAPLGNLYYFTWGAFLACFFLCASCAEDYNAAKAMARNSNMESNQEMGMPNESEDLHVEDMDAI